MTWHPFHHPDISWPVVKRRASREFMELLEFTTFFLCKGGWGVVNQSCYPSTAAFKTASSRLRTQGLVVWQSQHGATPRLKLTPAGKEQIPAYFTPEKYWDRSWNKTWYLLIYDVPEVDRTYRNTLRGFLKRKRMGCLQQSVWVTPEDIRPDFDDLSKAAAINDFAYLLESKTVLGVPDHRVVTDAWNFDRLQDIQERYCSIMIKNLDQLADGKHTPDDLAKLLRMSLDAYHAAMTNDPLLPHKLHPTGYVGKQVVALNRRLFSEIDQQLLNYI